MKSRPQVPAKAHKSSSSGGKQGPDVLEERKIGNGSTLKLGGGGQRDIDAELMRANTDELQSTSSSADPSSWRRWRKELAFAALMLTAATIGSLKTMFVTVNAVVATQLNVSYVSAAAVTGVPLMMGALAGLASQILSQSIGKRGIYVVSSVTMLLAAVWNMHVTSNYVEFMFSRIFEGVAWGAMEVLISGSISDLFLENERAARTNIINLVSILFTWGSPILGGYLSQSTESFRNQIMVINIIQAFAIAILILGTPETTFNRSSSSPSPAASTTGLKSYLPTLRLTTPHSTQPFSLAKAMQPLKSLYAPSTILTMLLSAPLSATAFGLAQSLSLIFTTMPTFLFPSRLGYLFIVPLIIALATYSISSSLLYFLSKPPRHLSSSTSSLSLGLSIPALLLGVAGLLSLGVYTENALMPKLEDVTTIFDLLSADSISLKAVSLLFGLLVAGSTTLSYTAHTALSSHNPTKSSLLRSGVSFYEEFLKGIWTIGMPIWIQSTEMEGGIMAMGLKDTGIALSVVALVVGSSVCVLLWCKREKVGAVDERVLGRVDGGDSVGGEFGLEKWDSRGSFMDDV